MIRFGQLVLACRAVCAAASTAAARSASCSSPNPRSAQASK